MYDGEPVLSCTKFGNRQFNNSTQSEKQSITAARPPILQLNKPTIQSPYETGAATSNESSKSSTPPKPGIHPLESL